MFVRLVYESFRRQKRRKLLAGAAITLGVTVATAMIAVATDIGDKINRELRTIGANLVVTPQEDSLDVEIGGVNLKPPTDGAFLSEADLPKIKGIFWHNNITGFAPMLPVNAGIERDGKRQDVTLLGNLLCEAGFVWDGRVHHRRALDVPVVESFRGVAGGFVAGRFAGRATGFATGCENREMKLRSRGVNCG